MIAVIDGATYVYEMEKILPDISKFIEVTFNSWHKVDKETQNLFDTDSSIKSV